MGEETESESANLFSFRRILQYLWRATWWRCPVCGTRPIFIPVRQVRNFHDWLTPLDGCPVCGYAYDREPGYFLMSVWAIGYAASAVVGIAIYVYLQVWHSDLSLTLTLLAVALPLPIVNVLFARHAKAYFLAIDHVFDPHLRPSDEDDDDWNGGDGRKPPAPVSPPRGIPVRDVAPDAGGDLSPERATGRQKDAPVETR
jgi:uncharacterized protein (DUF983 family)